jgi:C_GCAxxG_C_C family probable redox protein
LPQDSQGGLAQGKTCGAVTAAVMVIGLKYSPGLCADPYKKELCRYLTQEFCHRFRQSRRTTQCSKILGHHGVNPSDPAQMKYLREKKICDKIVYDAVVILERLFCETEADNPPEKFFS